MGQEGGDRQSLEPHPADFDTVAETYIRQIESLMHAKNVQEQELHLLTDQYIEQKRVAGSASRQLKDHLQRDVTALEFQVHQEWSNKETLLGQSLENANSDLEKLCLSGSQLLSHQDFLFRISPSSPPPATPSLDAVGATIGASLSSQSQRQSRYSMINELRLGHKPNQRDGLKWSEINAAWSQLAQAVYFVTSSTVKSSSISFYIVPLAQGCSKIIELDKISNRSKYVHNLGIEKDDGATLDVDIKFSTIAERSYVRAIVAFYRLLCQLMSQDQVLELSSQRRNGSSATPSYPPYHITENSVEGIIIQDKDEIPDHELAAIIHIVASTTYWLLAL
jgi:hypothetical protein